MPTTPAQFQEWLAGRENEHLEFKEAKTSFEFEELVKYCAALANECGGRMVLGVTDRKPRQVVGSAAFENPERTVAGLIERLHLKIEAEELFLDGKRVLIFHVPSRPIGVPIQYKGAYWMRCGESLGAMTPDQLRRIFDETTPDHSAEVCPAATLVDLAPAAIEEFRRRWIQKSGNQSLASLPAVQLLQDAELLVDGKPTVAALVLFGTRLALGRHLAQAELVFEYRSSDASGPAQQRLEFREGFFVTGDKIWETINLRNDKQHYQDGLFVLDVPTFNERVVREALLNAVSHRDYRLPGSVFIRQYPQRLEIVSPGGFPPGITPENILWSQSPRNRRIAEAFAKCGLVERSGQGANLMLEESVRQSKPPPDYGGSDNYQVFLTIRGLIQDPLFLRFLEQVGQETLNSFSTRHFLALDCVHREQPVPETCRSALEQLLEAKVVERIGRGKFMLARRFYALAGKPGHYTRRKGLDHETNKALLLKHLTDAGTEGAPLSVLCQVLPALPQSVVQRLLHELRAEGRAALHGTRRWARWFVTAAKAQGPVDPKLKIL